MTVSLPLKLLTTTALLLGSVSAVNAQQSTFRCGVLNRTDVVANVNGGAVNTTAFSPFAILNFTIPGSANSCVIVDFSIVGTATVYDPDVGNDFIFRAVIDGTIFNIGAGVNMIESPRGPAQFVNGAAHSYSFVFPSVPPGQHTLMIQARVIFAEPPPAVPGGEFQEWVAVVRHR